MSVGLSLTSLAEEFQQAKKRLREVEDGLQKHSGRPNVGQQRFRNRGDLPANLRPNLAQRLDDNGQANKRHYGGGGAFSRLGRQLNPQEAQRIGNNNHGPSAPKMARRDQPEEKAEDVEDEAEEEGEIKKPSLLSSIGASSINVKGKSRTELLKEQKSDKKVIARNRRMFGALLGTLKSFEKEETTKRKEQVEKKVEIEQKVEERKEKEREENRRQHRELVNERRQKKVQLRRLHFKMDVVGAFEEFSKRHKYMSNFIYTSGKPPIMWLPKIHTDETEKLLERSRVKIEAIIAKEEERVKLEIEKFEGVAKDSDGEADEKENATLQSIVTLVETEKPKDDEPKADIVEESQEPAESEAGEAIVEIKQEDITEESQDKEPEVTEVAEKTAEQSPKKKDPDSDSSSASEDEAKPERKRRDSTSTTSSSSEDESRRGRASKPDRKPKASPRKFRRPSPPRKPSPRRSGATSPRRRRPSPRRPSPRRLSPRRRSRSPRRRR